MPRVIDRPARKAELAEAVWQIIVERGIGAVSVRSVAQQAGVVVGSLRHVFPTRAELLVFSAELMVERATERIRAIPPDDDTIEYALAVVTHLLPLAPDSRAELDVNIAIIAESPALPELVAVRDEAYHLLLDLCHRLVARLTGRTDDPSQESMGLRLHALIDGLAVHLMTQAPEDDAAWALSIMREELETIAASAAS